MVCAEGWADSRPGLSAVGEISRVSFWIMRPDKVWAERRTRDVSPPTIKRWFSFALRGRK